MPPPWFSLCVSALQATVHCHPDHASGSTTVEKCSHFEGMDPFKWHGMRVPERSRLNQSLFFPSDVTSGERRFPRKLKHHLSQRMFFMSAYLLL